LSQALQRELDRSFKGRLRHLGPEDRAALEKMLGAAVNRLMHEPTVKLRRAATDRSLSGLGFEELAAALDALFGPSASSDVDLTSSEAPEAVEAEAERSDAELAA